MTTKPEFQYLTFINVPVKKVWEALTSPEFTEKYWHATRVQSDWKEGSPVVFLSAEGNVVAKGDILKVDEFKELSYTWSFPLNPEVKDERPSTVHFFLEEVEGMTKLTVQHYDFDEDSKMLAMITPGWAEVLSSLKSLLETGKALKLAGN